MTSIAFEIRRNADCLDDARPSSVLLLEPSHVRVETFATGLSSTVVDLLTPRGGVPLLAAPMVACAEALHQIDDVKWSKERASAFAIVDGIPRSRSIDLRVMCSLLEAILATPTASSAAKKRPFTVPTKRFRSYHLPPGVRTNE